MRHKSRVFKPKTNGLVLLLVRPDFNLLYIAVVGYVLTPSNQGNTHQPVGIPLSQLGIQEESLCERQDSNLQPLAPQTSAPPIKLQSPYVGVKGFEPIEFLMCQIYSLMPIHHLSSTPKPYFNLVIQRYKQYLTFPNFFAKIYLISFKIL